MSATPQRRRRQGGRAAKHAAARPPTELFAAKIPGSDLAARLVAEEIRFDGRAGDDAAAAAQPESRSLVIACGALAREILALLTLNGWDHVDVACLPALLHNRPEQIAPRLARAIAEARQRGVSHIMVGYADCGSGGDIDKVCADAAVSRLPGPHCYAFFEGVDAALKADAQERDMRTFFLTDFLARQFDAVIWRGLGLDRAPELRDAYFGAYERVTYLAQTDNADLDAAAKAAAERLGLAFERRMTGYGDLSTELERFAAPTETRNPRLESAGLPG